MSDNKNNKVIHIRNLPGNRGFVNLIKEAMEAAKEGYIVDDSCVGIYTGPLIHGQWRISLRKEVEETNDEVVSILDNPKAKGKELIDWALAEHNIVVPVELNKPAQIKKYIKDQLSSTTNKDVVVPPVEDKVPEDDLNKEVVPPKELSDEEKEQSENKEAAITNTEVKSEVNGE